MPPSTFSWTHHPGGPWAVHALTITLGQLILAEQLILSATDVLNLKDEQYDDRKPLWNLSFRSGDFEFDTPVERPDAITNSSILSNPKGILWARFRSDRYHHSYVSDRWCPIATNHRYGN